MRNIRDRKSYNFKTKNRVHQIQYPTFINPIATPPTGAKEGDIWIPSDQSVVFGYVGGNWVLKGDNTQTVVDKGLLTAGTVAVSSDPTLGLERAKAGMTAAGSGPTAVRFWAGNEKNNNTNAPFMVYENGHVVMKDAEVTGIINAIGGEFSGYIKTPFIDIEDSDAVLMPPWGYLLKDNLNVMTYMDQVLLPCADKYAGSTVSIYNNAWPPFTKTFSGTYVRTENGEKICCFNNPSQIASETNFLSYVIVYSGVYRFMCVKGTADRNGVFVDCIRWILIN